MTGPLLSGHFLATVSKFHLLVPARRNAISQSSLFDSTARILDGRDSRAPSTQFRLLSATQSKIRHDSCVVPLDNSCAGWSGLFPCGCRQELGKTGLQVNRYGSGLAVVVTTPLIGPLLETEGAVFFFSYGGMLFDLLIVPALLWSRTRPFAFVFCIFFHVTNKMLFDIGIFPFLAIAATTIFFSPDWPRRVNLLFAPFDASAKAARSKPGHALESSAYGCLCRVLPVRSDRGSIETRSLSRECALDRGRASLCVAHEAKTKTRFRGFLCHRSSDW